MEVLNMVEKLQIVLKLKTVELLMVQIQAQRTRIIQFILILILNIKKLVNFSLYIFIQVKIIN